MDTWAKLPWHYLWQQPFICLELPDKEDSNEAENITPRVIFLRFLTWTGIISYGIYM